jgi:hypothetical protein
MKRVLRLFVDILKASVVSMEYVSHVELKQLKKSCHCDV